MAQAGELHLILNLDEATKALNAIAQLAGGLPGQMATIGKTHSQCLDEIWRVAVSALSKVQESPVPPLAPEFTDIARCQFKRVALMQVSGELLRGLDIAPVELSEPGKRQISISTAAVKKALCLPDGTALSVDAEIDGGRDMVTFAVAHPGLPSVGPGEPYPLASVTYWPIGYGPNREVVFGGWGLPGCWKLTDKKRAELLAEWEVKHRKGFVPVTLDAEPLEALADTPAIVRPRGREFI